MTIWRDLHSGVVHPWLCDQFGHLNVRHYAHLFNEAMFHSWQSAGLGRSVVLSHGGHGVAGIVRTNFLRELPVGALVRTDGALVAASQKTCTFLMRMLHVETGEVHATMEAMEVFFDPETRRARPIPDALRPVIEAELAGPDAAPDLTPIPRTPPVVARWHSLNRNVCFPWHCDQWGHMNVRWYADFFDDAVFHLWPRLGIGWTRMKALGLHTVTASTVTHFRRELRAGDLFMVAGGVVRCGTKSVTFRLQMTEAESGEPLAFQDVVEVFFNPATRTSTAIPDEIRAALTAELEAAPA